MTRWLVTGAGGMLGREMAAALSARAATALGHDELDITDADVAERAVRGHDVVVNCAAWTDVDGAERDERGAFAVNALGPLRLAEACGARGAALVHVSTDYVFAGTARVPYGTADRMAPLSAYGRTKAAGEWAVRSAAPQRSWIVRTAWLYGARTTGFVPTMLGRARDGRPSDVVADVRGQPTWARHVAARIVELIDRSAPPGVYHAVSSGEATWYEFARAIYEESGADPALVRPVSAAAVPRPAPRPAYSVLHDHGERLGLTPLPHWRAALAAAHPELATGTAVPDLR
ncbi:dTDP-4-dehydrorhamnose reductase [Actinomadura sp. ATCC 31491]|uniref:dTDP-4-dehydrorhamnose reductase n=1 Tax=Actinomadura luzonensis TaxID=2805427 RepID=A0ABT0G932_9ACTN|nr:dTDP-4-dehydrorhamnose reductase [Actinomadura luzonensis]MCK2221109.1 dTDP-4-dehydrorhamnose reductase [Actinomadura luzonensis]